MNELLEQLKLEFHDKETRHTYVEDFLNTSIATQLKVLREDREWTQAQVAAEAGMAQERISVLENVNYDAWSVKTLKRLARAFDLRLSIKFESFGSFLRDFEDFNRETLSRPSFENDPAFVDSEIRERAVAGVPPALGDFRKPTNPFVPQIAVPDEESRLTQKKNVARLEDKKHGDTGRQNR